jgi:nicotinate dehydrogenase subunit A
VRIPLTINGHDRALDVEPDTPLLYALRNDLHLNGPKVGCGAAQCGACTVIMNGRAIHSCVVPVIAAANRRITTLDGLGTADNPYPIQQAFIDEQAAQCGYCTNGMIMTAKALLDRHPDPTEQQIRAALPEISAAAARISKSLPRSGVPLRREGPTDGHDDPCSPDRP